MAEPTATTATPAATNGSDWPAEAADAIERAVGSVRDATTTKALTAARALVYGMFALIVGLAAVVLFAIVAVRFLDAYLPEAIVGDDHTWVAHLVTGGVFALGGLVMITRARRTPRDEEH
jgi:hypothetical protein